MIFLTVPLCAKVRSADLCALMLPADVRVALQRALLYRGGRNLGCSCGLGSEEAQISAHTDRSHDYND